MFTDAFVDAFVMAAKDDEVLFHGKMVAHRLIQKLAIGTHVDDFIVVALAFEVGDAVVDRLDHHHHARTGCKRIVVHLVVLVGAVVTEVMQANFHNAFVYSTFDDGFGKRSLKHFGKNSDNINAHESVS